MENTIVFNKFAPKYYSGCKIHIENAIKILCLLTFLVHFFFTIALGTIHNVYAYCSAVIGFHIIVGPLFGLKYEKPWCFVPFCILQFIVALVLILTVPAWAAGFTASNVGKNIRSGIYELFQQQGSHLSYQTIYFIIGVFFLIFLVAAILACISFGITMKGYHYVRDKKQASTITNNLYSHHTDSDTTPLTPGEVLVL